ncbi:hypothetical protein PAPYR_9385 [Paratrimastix pyriformis]|uniref:Secreted protein n=1 Tax=Paratrimastix pyriformis TaxID=342808 RepID=A0ABQ8UE77_9EUKA|nr:hypothetical protein PAPYR_9385 [Paratrimastix pyriformis]
MAFSLLRSVCRSAFPFSCFGWDKGTAGGSKIYVPVYPPNASLNHVHNGLTVQSPGEKGWPVVPSVTHACLGETRSFDSVLVVRLRNISVRSEIRRWWINSIRENVKCRTGTKCSRSYELAQHLHSRFCKSGNGFC